MTLCESLHFSFICVIYCFIPYALCSKDLVLDPGKDWDTWNITFQRGTPGSIQSSPDETQGRSQKQGWRVPDGTAVLLLCSQSPHILNYFLCISPGTDTAPAGSGCARFLWYNCVQPRARRPQSQQRPCRNMGTQTWSNSRIFSEGKQALICDSQK